MKQTLATFVVIGTIAFGWIGSPSSANAQVVVIYTPQPVSSVVCQVRRDQFIDSYGWRVRDVIVCFSH